jgi:hypothetical protein
MPESIRLSRRDLAILAALHASRYLNAPQIQALFWQASKGGEWGRLKACQRRLRQLNQRHLVRRIELPVKRGEGPKPYIYALDQAGAQLLAGELGLDPREIEWQPKDAEENYPFLEHTLATNDLRIAFTLAAQTHQGELERWVGEKELKSEGMKEYVTVTGPQGKSQKVALIPDGYFVLRLGEKRGHFFLEVDRRTVTVEPSVWERRGWVKKVSAYLAYYQDGHYQARFGTRSLRVLTVTTGERRLAHLKGVTETAGAKALFWFTTFAQATSAQVLTEPIWQVAGQEGLTALLG